MGTVTRTLYTADDRAWLPATDVATVGGVRRVAVALGTTAGLRPSALGGLAIIATEIATNLARHADDGMVLLRLVRNGDAAGVELVAIDRGPGMHDFNASSVDGFSTSGTLGIGLGAIARMATELDVYSRVGLGTVLAATLWNGRPEPRWYAGATRPFPSETMCGDAYAVREARGRRQLMLADGLGHGPLAAIASQAAVVAFRNAPEAGPKEVLAFLHDRMGHTRGAVVGVVELDTETEQVRYAGIGNIAAVVCGSQRRAMVSMPGILGQQKRDIREFAHPLPPDALVVLHSDGLTDRWDLADYPGLAGHTPIVVAGTLLRDLGRRRDDAAVLVARP
jgi:anti-sigma regulatory factor (Ser/Thr protein kinase)